MTEHDDFYEKLPYTLEENQVTPEYVIFGTGLQETLIAAYKSKMEGKVGLIIDTEKTYGSSLKTVTFKEFNLLATHQASEKMYNFITPESYREKN
jgi:RAB protein geranylgeranyltransferase component A